MGELVANLIGRNYGTANIEVHQPEILKQDATPIVKIPESSSSSSERESSEKETSWNIEDSFLEIYDDPSSAEEKENTSRRKRKSSDSDDSQAELKLSPGAITKKRSTKLVNSRLKSIYSSCNLKQKFFICRTKC
jgi:hypothetical protein